MSAVNTSIINKELSCTSCFGNVLIVGAGPVAINVAVNISNGWCNNIGLVSRKSFHLTRFKEELKQNNYIIKSKAQGEKLSNICGKVKLKYFYEGYNNIDDIWDTIIMCTPSDSYKDVINDLNVNKLKQIKTIILISPSIGSNLLVNSQLKIKDKIDVISFSNYYAATKFESSNLRATCAFTKALKKRIYISSSKNKSKIIFDVKNFIESFGVQCTIVSNTIEAESKNITTYVHPPFFINEFSLNEILTSRKSKKYMYKIYPEGPITQHSIRTMLLLWKEISKFIQYFNAKPINLLKFLNDDNYPVHEITISREDIENFMELDEIKQQYLLYIRYSAILIDPFSIPDENGKYFDFSAVPYKQVYKDENGKLIIPRIPFEDYKKLKLIYNLAKKINIDMPQTLELIKIFEKKLNEYINREGKHSFNKDIFIDKICDEVDDIFNEMERKK
ncbi:opine metallophore biosynthesis dehydrogenase [Tepidibacter thalassicus]|uniref:DUF2338 domain-containing protein n=1 Tax=Tepidibacter thalassicus DSM 15285 TaxID=1123350 RepID=A0A1M5QR08_9FIRM|nr:opine metallophore biosynthesis dehydrogenase [Tepidibacter thalassicus]SHH16512.1 hypothetical protein SAMN02744040_01054 [Tepidibacter thalassicus DSM 15285]